MNKKRRRPCRWLNVVAAVLLSELALGPATRAAANPLTVATGVHLSEGYDDNIFFRANKVDDYITQLGLRLNLSYLTPSSTTSLSTGATAAFFARRTAATIDLARAERLVYSTNYQYSPRLSFAVNDFLGRIGSARGLGFVDTTATAGATGTGTAGVDPAAVNPNGVNLVLPHGSALTNSFGVTASYLLSPVWTGGLSYNNGVSNFTDPNSTDLTQRVGLRLAYQWSEALSLNSGYTSSRFNPSTAPHTEGHTATVGAEYTIAPLWSVYGTTGASLNRPVQSSNTSTRTSFTFAAGLNRASEQSSLSLGAHQGLTPSAGVAGTSVTLGGFLRYDRELTEYLTGTLHTSYTNFDTSAGNFNVYQMRAALFYALWRNVTAAIVYGYARRESNQSISNTLQAGAIDSNSVSIQIGTTFQLWQLDV